MTDYWARKMRLVSKPRENYRQDTTLPSTQIRLASLIEESIVDGPGLRFVVFAQGCPHRCPGCHNPTTHLPIGGKLVSAEEILSNYDQNPACRGITLSGGEPFDQAGPLAKVAEGIHQRGGDVIAYTGYRLERLNELAKTDQGILALLKETDLLIDGPFLLEKRCLEVPFVGSTNQRLVALSPVGNSLLEEIPFVPEGPMIKRILYK